ncbi:MAG: glycosyltransferase [Parcubacteria group bacterium]|jgi:glycosyltransferase involved in cell wall biosynthesis
MPSHANKKILIVGNAPLPFENTSKNFAAGTRTWQFAEPLTKQSDFKVDVYLMMLPNVYEKKPANFSRGNVNFFYYTEKEIISNKVLQKKRLGEEYSAIAGINTFPAYAAALAKPKIPFWADLNGYIMAEAQSRAAIEKSDQIIRMSWRHESEIVMQADKISAISLPQKYAVIGELAVTGRLNRLTNGYDFVEYIPNPVFREDRNAERKGSSPKFPIDKEKFNIFWSSGYNTWADVDILFQGLEEAMEIYPDIRYISTGGIIKGHDDQTFLRFKKMADQSKFKDNFIFLGWLPSHDVPYYYQNCDLGIVCDKNNYETLIGGRNRINDMMHFNMPILTSRLSEISEIVAKNGLGLSYEVSNAEDLVKKIIFAYENREAIREMAEKSHDYAMENFTPEVTTKIFREWLKNPKKSPDSGKFAPLAVTSKNIAGEFFNSLRKNGIATTAKYTWRFFQKRLMSR